MDVLRSAFDKFYNSISCFVFALTKKDPEKASEFFKFFLRTLYRVGIDSLILDNAINYYDCGVPISNAAGLNKNGEIPPITLKYMGFDRVVVGTVTGDEWSGNSRPRVRRYPKTESLINWMGFPGVGVERVAENLRGYGNHGVPLTINFMSTPGKKGDVLLSDLEKTIRMTRDLSSVDRFELNISCPNTGCSSGCLDARDEYIGGLVGMLETVRALS